MEYIGFFLHHLPKPEYKKANSIRKKDFYSKMNKELNICTFLV